MSKKVLVTGANGFIGKNLMVHLQAIAGIEAVAITRSDDDSSLPGKLNGADIIFHLAGVNRPANSTEFEEVNTLFTEKIVRLLENNHQPYKMVFTSSAQALLDNPYGKSKLAAEKTIQKSVLSGEAVIYRLPGVFGKWCRPDYNSVVATFCNNIAHDIPVFIRDPAFSLTLVYIDDVIKCLLKHIDEPIQGGRCTFEEVTPHHQVTLGSLVEMIQSFKNSRNNLLVPKVGHAFEKALYSTYLSYLPANAFSYNLELKTDNRGWLFELLKSPDAGQIFLSSTLPGITRGNHFHHTKTEKFVVIQGEGLIRFRKVDEENILEYRVSGSKPSVVDIPPGYTHSITNVGTDVMITLFWANEIFNQQAPDTVFTAV